MKTHLQSIAKEIASELTPLEIVVLISINKQIGLSLHGHNRIEVLLRGVDKNIWPQAKKIIKRFNGELLERYRSDTYRFTKLGREVVKVLLSNQHYFLYSPTKKGYFELKALSYLLSLQAGSGQLWLSLTRPTFFKINLFFVINPINFK